MSDHVNFADYIENERARLKAEDADLARKLAELHQRSAEIQNEFAALDAYHSAKTGKVNKERVAQPVTRARRGSRREGIMTLLSQSPNGMRRSELLDALGIKGDKSGDMSVSNALTGLQRAGRVVRGDGKRWTVVTAEGLEATAE